MSSKNKQLKRLERQNGLLQEFSQEEDHYEEKKIGENWYVKNWNGGTKRWQVAIYSNASFRKYKGFQEKPVDLNWIV